MKRLSKAAVLRLGFSIRQKELLPARQNRGLLWRLVCGCEGSAPPKPALKERAAGEREHARRETASRRTTCPFALYSEETQTHTWHLDPATGMLSYALLVFRDGLADFDKDDHSHLVIDNTFNTNYGGYELTGLIGMGNTGCPYVFGLGFMSSETIARNDVLPRCARGASRLLNESRATSPAEPEAAARPRGRA